MSVLQIADDFALDTARFEDEGLRIGIFASPGAGKGYTLGVLLEELIEAGYPCVMADPESELWTFRELGALVVGGPHGHVPFPMGEPRVLEEALAFCLETATPVVFDLGGFETDAEVREAFDKVARAYWRLISDARRPSVFAVTEAHVIAPQAIQRGEKAGTMLATIVSRGRKRGATTLIETQRMAEIANAVISHCNVRFIGRVDYEDDFKRVAKGMPGVSADEVRKLDRGSFYVPRLHDGPIRVRERRVTHGAVTPGAGEVKLRRAKEPSAIAELAERLNALILPPSEPEPEAAPTPAKRVKLEVDASRRREQQAWRRVEGLEAHVAELEEQIESQAQVILDLGADSDVAVALRAALASFLGDKPVVVAGDGGYPGDGHIVRLIRENAPKGVGQIVKLQPVEKLRAGFLERSAQRLVDAVQALDEDERQALLFLLTRPTYVAVTAITVALSGHDGGGQRDRWAKATKSLAAKGLVTIGGTSNSQRRENVEGWVKAALSPHVPTEAEIASVRDRALSLLQEPPR